MSYQTLIIEDKGDMVTVALNRSEVANALNIHMARELCDVFKSIHRQRVILLTGKGKNFCAGADLKERRGMDRAQWHAQHEAFEAALAAIMTCEIPVIAAVNGAAFGGGLELALACDFIYAADHARFALTETTLGIMPGMGGTQSLSRAIGLGRAKELIFSGKTFTAEQAVEWGMVNAVYLSEILLQEALGAAQMIAKNAPLAVRAAKKSMNEGIALPLKEALAYELKYYNSLLDTKDRHEGINAFNEKRKPVFTGE